MTKRVRRLVLGTVAVSAAAGLLSPAAPGGGATKRAALAATNFQAAFNTVAARKGWPQRISSIYCRQDGVFFDCGVVMRTKGKPRPLCGVITIDVTYRVWVNHRVPCPRSPAPPPA